MGTNLAARNTPERLLKTSHGSMMQTCPKHGPYEQKTMKGFGVEFKTGCPKCDAEAEAVRNEQKIADRYRGLLSEANIPKRFKSSTLDGYEAVNEGQKKALTIIKKYVSNFESLKEKGCSLVFCGPPGTGKTHLACAIGKAVMKLYGASSRYASAWEVMQSIKATYSQSSSESEFEVMGRYTGPNLLIFDEVGVQFGTNTETMITYQIINKRYENMSPTIMISNLNEKELCGYIGERSVDRMREGGGAVVQFDWESWRK